MREVILYMSTSLDGFVSSDREHPGMAVPEGDELKRWKLDRVRRAGAHLIGRVTYQEMSSYWPRSDNIGWSAEATPSRYRGPENFVEKTTHER